MRGRDRRSNGSSPAESLVDRVPGSVRLASGGDDSLVGLALLAAAVPLGVLLIAYPVAAICFLAGAFSAMVVERLQRA